MSEHNSASVKLESSIPDPDDTHLPSFQLSGLPLSLSESLPSGTSIPAPPSSSPPTSQPQDMPSTPTKLPPSSSKRNLSSTELSPTATMPGTYPSSPLASPSLSPQTPNAHPRASYTASAYASPPPSNPNYNDILASKSPKRSASLRNFLSFKVFRRSSQNAIPDSPSDQTPKSPHSNNYRPASPGASSLSSFRPSLSTKMSGSSWMRRKSSLGIHAQGVSPGAGDGGVVNGPATVYEDEEQLKRPGGVTDDGDLVSAKLRKRKSGTFWRRKSSFGVNGDGENVYLAHGEMNGNGNTNANGAAVSGGGMKDLGSDTAMSDAGQQQEDARVKSPPPVIPVLDGMRDGGSFGAEDFFSHIR